MRRQFSKLPPPEVAKQFEGLSTLLEEHGKVLSAFRANKSEYEQLELERQRARNKDGKARVQAYRQGKEDPGTKHEAQVLRRIEELRDKQSVLEAAYEQIEKDIGALVSKQRHEWLPMVRDLVQNDDEELAALLERVGETMQRRQAHTGLHQWIAELPPSYQAKAFVQGGASEDVAYRQMLSSVGQTLREKADPARAIGETA